MLRTLSTSLAVLAIAAAGGCSRADASPSQDAPEALTWMVLDEINSAYFERTESFNRPAIVTKVPDGVIRPVDISHDGVADWLVDYTDSGLMYCGTGGCLRTLYVSHEGEFIQAFDEQTDTFVIGQRNGETVIDATVHQVYCTPASDQCAYAWTWDAAQKRLVERPNARGVTLLTDGGDFDPIGTREPDQLLLDSLPASMVELWRTTRVTCPTTQDDEGFRNYRATFKSVPDLNGDGLRDWIVQLPGRCALNYDDVIPQPGYNVYLTGGDRETLTKAFTAEPDESAAIDIATTPAMLVANPPCEQGKPCRNVRLRWDQATSRFVPAR